MVNSIYSKSGFGDSDSSAMATELAGNLRLNEKNHIDRILQASIEDHIRTSITVQSEVIATLEDCAKGRIELSEYQRRLLEGFYRILVGWNLKNDISTLEQLFSKTNQVDRVAIINAANEDLHRFGVKLAEDARSLQIAQFAQKSSEQNSGFHSLILVKKFGGKVWHCIANYQRNISIDEDGNVKASLCNQADPSAALYFIRVRLANIIANSQS